MTYESDIETLVPAVRRKLCEVSLLAASDAEFVEIVAEVIHAKEGGERERNTTMDRASKSGRCGTG